MDTVVSSILGCSRQTANIKKKDGGTMRLIISGQDLKDRKRNGTADQFIALESWRKAIVQIRKRHVRWEMRTHQSWLNGA